MHLSSQEEYGLRCLLQLARHEADEPMRIQEIAEAEGLSAEYVAKLMRILRNGGLVSSTRGAGGGYHLQRSAADITLWEAIDVLGGPLFPDSFCDSHPGALRDCVHAPGCSIRSVWSTLNGLLREAMSSITVEDLKGEAKAELRWITAMARAQQSDAPRTSGAGAASTTARWNETPESK